MWILKNASRWWLEVASAFLSSMKSIFLWILVRHGDSILMGVDGVFAGVFLGERETSTFPNVTWWLMEVSN